MSLQGHCLERGCEFQVDPLGLSNSLLYGGWGSTRRKTEIAPLKEQSQGRGIHFPYLGVILWPRLEEIEGGRGRQRDSSGERKLQAERTAKVLTRRMRGKLRAKGCGSVTGLVRSESHNRGQSSSFLQEYDKDQVLSEWIGRGELLLSILSRGLSW